MHITLRKTIALLGLAAILSSCGDARVPEDTASPETLPIVETKPDTDTASTETLPAVTETEDTEPPISAPPETEATEPAVTKSPETDPPVTEMPETVPPETRPPETVPPETRPPETEIPGFTEIATVNPDGMENEADAIKDSPTIVIQIPELLKATAPGTAKKDSGSAVIDYSNVKD